MNKIYIGNLPSQIDKDKLASLFTICGPILNTEIIRYDDHEAGPRAYGFISFKDNEGAARACFFNKKGVYEGLLLTVQPADRQQYGTWIGGIPHHIKKEEITMFIQQNFGDRYYTINYDPKPFKTGCAYVNFKDDFDRTQFINNTTNITFSLSRRPQIKEFKKEVAPQNEDSLDVVISKIPEGIPSFELKSMFQLCGIRKASVMNTENSYTLAYITLTRSGYEIVKRFDNCKIKHWPVPIRVALKNQYNVKEEYPHGLLLKNFKLTLKLRDMEAKFFNHFGEDSVRLVRAKNDNSFLYVNCKKESDMDTILAVSGQICFEGNGPATFERCKGGGGNMKAAESMESIATLGTLSLRNQNRRALELPPVVWNITVGNVDSSVDFSKLSSLFSKMGNVRALTSSRVANNSYDIQLTPNL